MKQDPGAFGPVVSFMSDQLGGSHQPAKDLDVVSMTHAEWKAEGAKRFGTDPSKWKFVCPVCGHVASVQDWKDVGAFECAGFSCIGRHMQKCRKAFGEKGPGPCDYAGGGLFKLNPVEVKLEDGDVLHAFAFADP